jgi:biopolymer transport protein TolR|tara:strand:- start:229 stop:648 length:420 start_codon:yes stop_codon:yes gene_type:complete
MKYKKNKRKLLAEINVVPYIDVTLVLLVVFMVTAPLLIQGIDINLPKTVSSSLEKKHEDSLIISIKSNGNLYLNLGSKKELQISKPDLSEKVSEILKQNPNMSVLVRGDKNTSYGEVVRLMSLLQKSGVSSVGLVTEIP